MDSKRHQENFHSLCEWLRQKIKWQESIPLDLDLIENKIVDSLIFVEFLMMLEEITDQDITIDASLLPKVSSLNAIKASFFMEESQYV